MLAPRLREGAAMMDEDWKVVVSFLPSDWRELALETKALKGLRKDKCEERLLRTLLIHLACGYSLRETVVRARGAGLADLTDVALLKRLRKCQDWLRALCRALFAERGLKLADTGGVRMRLFDATSVKEPGQTGSLWRVHYSVQVPSLQCDHFELTGVKGEGTGESFKRFPIARGDYIIADRGYSLASGVHYVDSREAYVCVRLNPQSIPLVTPSGKSLPLLERLGKVTEAGAVASWPVRVPGPDGKWVEGRICAIRKTEEVIRTTLKKLKRRASKQGKKLRPQTLVYAEYVMVLTTFPEDEFPAAEVLEWYRIRWQVELVFKRFKQIAQLGHLPKHDDESAKAWLYGKLLVALLTEKIITCATSISPWGYVMEPRAAPKSMA